MIQDKRTDNFIKAITTTFPLSPGISRILEIGCGIGKNVALLNQQGYTTYGFENSPQIESFFQSDRILLVDFLSNLVGVIKSCQFDLVISLVVDDIDTSDLKNYLDNLCYFSDRILLKVRPFNQLKKVRPFNQFKIAFELDKRNYRRDTILESKFNNYMNNDSLITESIMIFKAIRFTGRS